MEDDHQFRPGPLIISPGPCIRVIRTLAYYPAEKAYMLFLLSSSLCNRMFVLAWHQRSESSTTSSGDFLLLTLCISSLVITSCHSHLRWSSLFHHFLCLAWTNIAHLGLLNTFSFGSRENSRSWWLAKHKYSCGDIVIVPQTVYSIDLSIETVKYEFSKWKAAKCPRRQLPFSACNAIFLSLCLLGMFIGGLEHAASAGLSNVYIEHFKMNIMSKL